MPRSIDFYGFSDLRSLERVREATRITLGETESLKGGPRKRPVPGLQVIAGKLTTRDTTDNRLYAFEQARATATGWEIVPEGLTGTVTARPALDMREDVERDDLGNKYVLLARGTMRQAGEPVDPEEPEGELLPGAVVPVWYIISDTEMVAEFALQVKQAVTQDQPGYDPVRATPEYPAGS